jgi:hypothetical protein
MLNIMLAELIEGNYVLYQGDLSTNRFVVGKSMGAEIMGKPGFCTRVVWI